jgi:hypothetical protein
MKTSTDLRPHAAKAVGWRSFGGVKVTYILLGLILALVVIWASTSAGGLGELVSKGAAISWAAPLAPVPITSLAGDETRPAVALSPEANSYLVVWEDNNNTSPVYHGIAGVLVGDEGIPYQDPIYISAYHLNKSLNPDVAANLQTGKFLVVWEYAYNESVDHNIHARIVGADGAPEGEVIDISTATTYETSPAVAYNSAANEWLVVWDSASDVHNRDINAAILDADGVVQNEFTIANGLDDQANPSVAYGSNYGEYLAVWEHLAYTSENLNLVAQLVAEDGSPVGEVIPISTWEYEQVLPELDYNPDLDEFMIVWEDHHWAWGAAADIYGQRVSADGTLAGGNFGISWEGGNLRLRPDIAYNTNTQEYLVIWEYEHSPSDHDVYQRRVSRTGELPDAEIPISNESSWEGLPALAVGNEYAFLVVWEDHRDISTRNANIYGDVVVPVSPPTTATATVTNTPKPTLTPTPTPTPTATATEPPSLDLQIDSIEITQGIQCKDNPECDGGDNSVPLVYGKATYVRVYVKVEGSAGPVPGVSASAIANTGTNQQITGTALNETISAPLIPNRANFADTLNFHFFPDELSSSGTIEVTVNPDRTIPESTYTNNSMTVPVDFVYARPLKIVPIWIHYKYGTKSSHVNLFMPFWLQSFTKNTLPIAEINWLIMPGYMVEWTEAVGPDSASWDKLLNKIRDIRAKNATWAYFTGEEGEAHFYGMFPKGDQEGGSTAGLGDYPGFSAVGFVHKTHENLEDMADVLVHELGHNFGRGHAPCGVDPPHDPDYPYSEAVLGDFGWDPQGAAGGIVQSLPGGWVVPQTHNDVMSYCQENWISEYTYRAILDYRDHGGTSGSSIGQGLMSRVAAEQDTWQYLYVSGYLSDTLVLDPWSILEAPSGYFSQTGEGEYSLRLTDERRQTLFERHFNMQASMPTFLPNAPAVTEIKPSYSFYEIVPWNPATAYVEIWQGSELLYERALSSSAPEVTLLNPSSGETWEADDETTIAWNANDADGDPLWFDVAFSSDGGGSWQMIATRLQSTDLQVGGDQFPGTTSAQVRVYASDGLRTSQATSGIFEIEDKGPTVQITLPLDGASVPVNVPVMLTGSAFDWEDGMLPGDSFTWRSDQAGNLGTGNQILTKLSQGWHTITLTVSDSDRMTASTSIRVYSGYRLHLPLVRR